MKIILVHFFAFLTGLMLSLGIATLYAEPYQSVLSIAMIAPIGFAITALVIVINKFGMLRGNAPVLPVGVTLLAGMKLIAFLMAPDTMWNWTMDAAIAHNMQISVLVFVVLTPFVMGGLHALVYKQNKKG